MLTGWKTSKTEGKLATLPGSARRPLACPRCPLDPQEIARSALLAGIYRCAMRATDSQPEGQALIGQATCQIWKEITSQTGSFTKKETQLASQIRPVKCQ